MRRAVGQHRGSVFLRQLRWRRSTAEARAPSSGDEARRVTAVMRRFPSWGEHAGIAILSVGMMNGALVVFGFFITWMATLKRYELDCKAAHLRSELERTNRQLEALFGPLRAITHATEVGWASFVAEHRGSGAGAALALEASIRAWPRSCEGKRYCQLVQKTLQPLNRRAMETLLSNTHLIDGEFPDCLYWLYSHVIEMDSLLERWAHRDFAAMFPMTPYPREVNRWADREFERLRKKQSRLLTELKGSVEQGRSRQQPS